MKSPKPTTNQSHKLYPDLNLLLDCTPRDDINLKSSHPQPVQIFRLWQTFLDNVNPLTKIFHAPTIQQAVLNASGDLDNVPKEMEALMFGIYSCAVVSMTSADCKAMLGESKKTLLAGFHSAAQRALQKAELLKTTDIMVLQAFILFLVSSQPLNTDQAFGSDRFL